MTHSELQAQVLAECKGLGLWALVIGQGASIAATPGWVDVFVLSPRGGCMAVELKSEDGRRTLNQIKVADLLVKAGIPYRLWRPSDWEAGTVLKELRALR